MEMKRCWGSDKDDLYRNYHDREWGVPVYDDKIFFEFLVLESFQAGLSWHTILKKREDFRMSFDHFNYHKIADYEEGKVGELMGNAGIIRNKLKILATINNAKRFQDVQEEFGSFSAYIWSFVGQQPLINFPKTPTDVPATTSLSDRLSQDLKRREFKFLGSTVVYALMQATGIVDDHLVDCHCKKRQY